MLVLHKALGSPLVVAGLRAENYQKADEHHDSGVGLVVIDDAIPGKHITSQAMAAGTPSSCIHAAFSLHP